MHLRNRVLGACRQVFRHHRALTSDTRSTSLAPLTMDTPFKNAFADRTDNLLFLLKTVLNKDGIFLKSIDNVERKNAIDRNVFYDIICTLTSGTKIIIEMQNLQQRAQLANRIVGYISRDYSEQWLKSKMSYELMPVHLIALLNFTLDKDKEKSGSMIQGYWASPKDGDVAADGFTELFRSLFDVTLVQLPLAPATADLCKTDAERLCLLIRDSAEFSLANLPLPFTQEPFRRIVDCARRSNLTHVQRDALALEEKSMRDEHAANEEREAAAAILVSKINEQDTKINEQDTKINEQDTKINELTAMLAKRNLEFDSLAARGSNEGMPGKSHPSK